MKWSRVRPLLERLLDLPEEERDAALAQQCAGDEELRRHVDALLAAGRARSDLFEPPAPFEPPAEHPDVGAQIGPWRLVRLLGEGGMGRVWLAERADSGFEQRAALKLIKRGMDTEAVLRRFRRERQVLADLVHPGIVRLLDGGSTEDGRPYLVLERVEGAPLDEHCRARDLSIEARLALFAAVVEAVGVAHRHGVVHRDLKPSNVMVTAAGEPKVLDFGIAKTLAEDGAEASLLTRTGERLLTPRYAAPEQVRGEETTPATDVYALGVMLYELLTSRPPYEVESGTLRELESAVCEERPPRPSAVAGRTLRRRLVGDLDVVVMRALAKEPARRYRDAGQLATDLRRHLAHEPIHARPDSRTYRAGKYLRRNRVLVGASLAVVLALALGLGLSERQRRLANARAEDAEWASYARSVQSMVGRLGQDLSINSIDLVGTPELRGWEWRHLKARSDQSNRELLREPGATWLAVDGTGSRLAITERDVLVLVDLATGEERRRIPIPGVRRPALSADGARLAYESGRTLHVLDLASGEELGAWELDRSLERAVFFRSGDRLAVADQSQVYLVSLDDPEGRHILADWKSRDLDLHPDEDRVVIANRAGTVHVVGIDDPGLSFHSDIHVEPEVVVGVAFSRSGRHVGAVTMGGLARLWDVEAKQALSLPFHKHQYCEGGVFRSGREEFVVPGMTLTLWDATSGRRRTLLGPTGTIGALAANPVTPRIYTCDAEGRIVEWDADAQPVPRHHLTAGECNHVSASMDGERYVAAVGRRTIALVELDTGRELARRQVPLGGLADLLHVASGELVCAGPEGLAVLDGRDLGEQERVALRGATCLALSPDGATLYVGTDRGSLWRCDTATWSVLDEQPTPLARVTALAAHPDGRGLTAAGEADVEAHDLDLRSGSWRAHRAHLGTRPTHVAVSPDGQWVALGGSKGVQVRSRADGAIRYERRVGECNGARFTADGKRAIYSAASEIFVVDLRRWEVVTSLRENERSIRDLDLTEGETLLTCDLAGGVSVWHTD